MNKNNKYIAFIVLAILVIVVAIFVKSGSTFSLIPSTFSSCVVANSSTPSGCSSSQVGSGGTITSLSQVTFSSNVGFFQGLAYLVNLEVTGQGQSLTGTQAQVVSALNSQTGSNNQTSNPNGNLDITAKIINETYYMPYVTSGQVINLWNYELFNNLNYNVKYAGYGYSNCYGSLSNNNYTLKCYYGAAGQGTAPAFYENMTAFSQACQNATGGTGTLSILGNGANVSGGISYILSNGNNPQEITQTFQCIAPTPEQFIRYVFIPQGVKKLFANVSVSFTNSSGTVTGYVSSTKTTQQINSNLYANLYGYEFSGSDLSGSGAPDILFYVPTSGGSEINVLFNSNYSYGYRSINPTQLGAIIANAYPNTGSQTKFTASETGGSVSYIVNGQTETVPNSAVLSSLQQNIAGINGKVVSLVVPTQNYSAYPYIPIIYGSFTYQAGFQGIVIPIVTNGQMVNTAIGGIPWYPDVQLIVKASTLGIYVPVATPKITGYSPQPFTVRAGGVSQLYITVENTGTTAGSIYVVGSCGSESFGSSSDAQSIGSGSQSVFQLSVNGGTNTGTNQTIGCSATAYSATDSEYSSSTNFNENLLGYCANETQYYNGNTCVAYTTIPTTSVTPQTCEQLGNCQPPPPPWYAGLGIYIVAGIVIIAVVYLITKRTGGIGGRGIRRSYNRYGR
jgi:hypothetical protein